MKLSNGMFMLPSGKIYIDQEWIDASNAYEKPIYYRCKMLNGGQCYKLYKPSLAALVLSRGMYLKMIPIEEKSND